MSQIIHSKCKKIIAGILLLAMICLLCACNFSKEKTHSGEFAGSGSALYPDSSQKNMP